MAPFSHAAFKCDAQEKKERKAHAKKDQKQPNGDVAGGDADVSMQQDDEGSDADAVPASPVAVAAASVAVAATPVAVAAASVAVAATVDGVGAAMES